MSEDRALREQGISAKPRLTYTFILVGLGSATRLETLIHQN
jgi:hypothetical protein